MLRASSSSMPGWSSSGSSWWVLALLLCCSSGCASRPHEKGGESAGAGVGTSVAPDAQAGVAVPFALCRGFGLGGTPCYPTNVDIGSLAISPCRERHRGHCELSGPRHTMACLLFPVPDGKSCGEGLVCKDGSCVKQ